MKWENLRRSSNVEDFRSSDFSRVRSGGGGLRYIFPIAKFLLGSKIGRIILLIGVIVWGVSSFLGYDPLSFLNATQTNQNISRKISKQDEKSAQFVSAVLAETEDVWGKLFRQSGMNYVEPKLVLFRNGIKSGCGYASSQTGPFYCQVDQKVYLDLSFFNELSRKYHSSGDFAQAYVVAHEIGHHVQNLLGTLQKAHRLKRGVSKKTANAIQVKVELQADCYAGVWAHYLNAVLEDGDIQEALHAASAIGDDTLQKQAQGYVVPDAFTHGRSVDRVRWFKTGYLGGKFSSCRTGI